MKENPILFDQRATEYKKKAKKEIKTCYHPRCANKSINTHILQKNGILSEISPNRHLWKLEIDRFKNPYYQFKRKGIENVFTFNGFCDYHDNELFKEIENTEIDFEDYRNFLKFSLRALYNEINRKEVIINAFTNLFADFPQYSSNLNEEWLEGKRRGVYYFKKAEKRIWSDIDNGTESYIYNFRTLPFLEICASGFFTYETTEEIIKYESVTGERYPEYTNIFFNLFPYKGKLILQIGHPKHMDSKVKPFVNQFFKLNEKKAFRLVTNNLLFSEVWVCSDKFHQKFIKGNEKLFIDAYFYTNRRLNERKNYDLNFLDSNFIRKFQSWHKNHILIIN